MSQTPMTQDARVRTDYHWYLGQHVRCIVHHTRWQDRSVRPLPGRLYTIKDMVLMSRTDPPTFFHFEELPGDTWWWSPAFRPVDERPTSIAVFRRALGSGDLTTETGLAWSVKLERPE